MKKYLKKLDNATSLQVGVLQGGVVALYVLGFAAMVTNVQYIMPHPAPALAISFVLISFVVSALICGVAVLGYPALLALKGKIARAIVIVFWSGVTLVATLLAVLLAILIAG